MKNFICNQYGERFAILNTENINICGWIRIVEAIKMQFVCFFFNICRKFQLLIFQGSVEKWLRWDGYCHLGFAANVMRFPTVHKFWKSVKIWQSYRLLKCGNFYETQCTSDAYRLITVSSSLFMTNYTTGCVVCVTWPFTLHGLYMVSLYSSTSCCKSQ